MILPMLAFASAKGWHDAHGNFGVIDVGMNAGSVTRNSYTPECTLFLLNLLWKDISIFMYIFPWILLLIFDLFRITM